MKTPAPEGRPPVDDHFLMEDAGVEVVRGALHMVPPAQEPHAVAHLSLAYVLAAHVAEGFLAAVDMLTRTGPTSDFAPDASVFPAARDPATGGRQLEELAFEVADTQPLPRAGGKARELVERGVRRVFCVVVKHRRVLEWSHDTDEWGPLPDSTAIDDRCFVRPLPVRALLDAADADAAVVAALVARRSPAALALTEQGRREGHAEGRAEGRAEGVVAALLTVLAARGLVATDAQLARIRAADSATLDGWLARVATVPSVAALLDA